MHDLATKFSTSTKNFPSAPSDDLLTPISISNRASDSFAWPQHLDYSIEANLDNWPLTTPTNATPRKSTSVNYYSTNMPLRTDLSDRTQDSIGSHWRFNNSGQLVDSISAGWDLSDDLARLNITDVSNKEPQLHTPPKSQYTSAAVASLNDASPLAETSSSVSIGSSPHTPEHDISISHSRGSSTDTTHSSVRSVKNSVLLAKPPLKVNTGNDIKERPHSFSGGLSSADLRRLQLAGEGPEATDRQQLRNQRDAMGSSEQLTYPSLTNNVIHRPQPQPYSQAAYEFRGSALTQQASDDLPDFAAQRNNFASLPQAPLGGPLPGPTAFVQGRPGNAMTTTFRQPPRAFPQQGPAPMGYTHAPHLSMGNSQQLYDMMLPGAHPDHPAVTRVQQQHNVYRPTHHHSNSDPSAAIRDVASMGMMGNNALPPFAPGMYQTAVPTIPMYPNQFYPGQEYSLPADAAVMAARLQPQYSGQYPVVPAPASVASDVQSNGSGGANNGPSANNRKLGLYKTELCRSWEEKGSCRYGAKCQFAHGEDELRKVSRHPKYKTEICRTFWVSGTCPYGKRCCFIHTELPNSGGTTASGGAATPTADTAPQPRTDGRARSMSTNSDPTEAPVSLLARIGKRAPESQQATPTEANSFQQIGRPGSLRLDTNVDNSAVKENKSAYPSFVSNPMLMSMPDRGGQKSPAPVTAGPDLGRHNAAARREIVGYNIRTHKPTSSASSIRHSLQSSEDLGINPSPIPSYSSINPGEGTRASGHIRSGSAGNWGSFSRSSHLQSPFPQQTSSPAGEIMATSPWPSTDLSGSTRINEKVWA